MHFNLDFYLSPLEGRGCVLPKIQWRKRKGHLEREVKGHLRDFPFVAVFWLKNRGFETDCFFFFTITLLFIGSIIIRGLFLKGF